MAFDPTLKKKKKKKGGLDLENEDPKKDDKQEITENAEQPDVDSGVALENEFAGAKKKKKKPKAIDEDKAEEEGLPSTGQGTADAMWPDYSYEELLNRVFNIMREKNPDESGVSKKFKLSPPQVGRAGSKKTAFANFPEICKQLKRTAKHLLAFLLAELGTSGSVDGNNQLIIKGRFQQKHIESVLRKYIKEYVTCHTCHSAATELQKDTRLFFLQCSTCGSRCSVAAIKSGYQAVTTRRAQMKTGAQP